MLSLLSPRTKQSIAIELLIDILLLYKFQFVPVKHIYNYIYVKSNYSQIFITTSNVITNVSS